MIGPFLDRYVVDAWVFQYDWRTAAMVCLGFSCALAVGVNLSQFACLGRFSAVSFQVSAAVTHSGSLPSDVFHVACCIRLFGTAYMQPRGPGPMVEFRGKDLLAMRIRTCGYVGIP